MILKLMAHEHGGMFVVAKPTDHSKLSPLIFWDNQALRSKFSCMLYFCFHHQIGPVINISRLLAFFFRAYKFGKNSKHSTSSILPWVIGRDMNFLLFIVSVRLNGRLLHWIKWVMCLFKAHAHESYTQKPHSEICLYNLSNCESTAIT